MQIFWQEFLKQVITLKVFQRHIVIPLAFTFRWQVGLKWDRTFEILNLKCVRGFDKLKPALFCK